ncbi:ABC transporter substrate-binding protein [Vibrio sp. SS-MA-C1-2]|uniref:ABC transporter substrate-binding protein n=1 Tax=Vibrio sp. SS-MA-C1-2 TaxID=2908646 RepID=UPI001F31264D|nr:ABC transporter substrate-binding protein [Vibrio sp. SS-MA-C1-2]UJF17906.1 ABC transporter substrate-binding protein [Vibrio sp. SS-MA-C1-2]
MIKNRITQTLLFTLGLSTFSTLSHAANVPDNVQLAPQQELVRGNGMEVASIDPHKAEGMPESHIMRDLFEGLVNQDGDGNTVAGTAESWQTTDNRTFTFTLRQDAKWSNGDTVTANDFVYSFQRIVDPNEAAPYAWFVETMTIKNATAVINGEKDKSELGIKAIDEHTLEIQLSEALPYFVDMLSHMALKPVHQETVEKFGDKWTKPENFVGNGAYQINKWVVNERIEVVRNPHYWDNENTVINKVTFLPIDNQISEMNRFFSNEIDITYEVPLEHFKHIKKKNPESLGVIPSLCSYYYAFNTRKAPFDDVRVRKALSYTIDRDIISNAVLGQGQKPAYLLTPEVVAGFEPKIPEYASMSRQERTKKAQELLAEAGFNEDNPLNFSLLYNTSESHKKVAIAIQSMWKKSLPVNVDLYNKEWKTYLDDQREGNFDVTRAGWCGDYNEASTFLGLMKSGIVSNQPKFANTDYDAIMQKAITVEDSVERNMLYNQAESVLANEMPIAPIYQYVQPRLIKPSVGGFPFNNGLEQIYSKDLYIKAN